MKKCEGTPDAIIIATDSGLQGKIIGMDTFGEFAPAGELFKEFGITTDAEVNAVNELTA